MVPRKQDIFIYWGGALLELAFCLPPFFLDVLVFFEYAIAQAGLKLMVVQPLKYKVTGLHHRDFVR